nr:hypothetical protein [Pantoea cypripedii]
MKSGLTIRSDKSQAVLEAFKSLAKKDVLVGIPSDRAERQEGMKINNAELGYLHSFGGTISIPEHMTTIHRQIDADGNFKRGGRFVKEAKSNFATDHVVPAHTVTLPPRPFLQMGIDDSREKTTGLLKKAAVAILDGNAGQASSLMNQAGIVASQAAKQVIQAGEQLTPLAESTLKARRSRGRTGTKPLYDTGGLLRSITYVMRDKNAGS